MAKAKGSSKVSDRMSIGLNFPTRKETVDFQTGKGRRQRGEKNGTWFSPELPLLHLFDSPHRPIPRLRILELDPNPDIFPLD